MWWRGYRPWMYDYVDWMSPWEMLAWQGFHTMWHGPLVNVPVVEQRSVFVDQIRQQNDRLSDRDIARLADRMMSTLGSIQNQRGHNNNDEVVTTRTTTTTQNDQRAIASSSSSIRVTCENREYAAEQLQRAMGGFGSGMSRREVREMADALRAGEDDDMVRSIMESSSTSVIRQLARNRRSAPLQIEYQQQPQRQTQQPQPQQPVYSPPPVSPPSVQQPAYAPPPIQQPMYSRPQPQQQQVYSSPPVQQQAYAPSSMQQGSMSPYPTPAGQYGDHQYATTTTTTTSSTSYTQVPNSHFTSPGTQLGTPMQGQSPQQYQPQQLQYQSQQQAPLQITGSADPNTIANFNQSNGFATPQGYPSQAPMSPQYAQAPQQGYVQSPQMLQQQQQPISPPPQQLQLPFRFQQQQQQQIEYPAAKPDPDASGSKEIERASKKDKKDKGKEKEKNEKEKKDKDRRDKEREREREKKEKEKDSKKHRKDR